MGPTPSPTPSPTSSPTTSSPTASPTTSSPKTSNPTASPTSSSPTWASPTTSSPTEKTTTTCASLGGKKQLKKFCKGRVDKNSQFPTFWELNKKLSPKEQLKQECETNTCTRYDCCLEGWERKCTTTNNKGKNEPFEADMCANGWVLRDPNQLKNKPCKGSKGKKCRSKDCCKKQKNKL